MMNVLTSEQLAQAVRLIKQGGVIAYPTEGVYGLGCDPFNEDAIRRLLAIKQRLPEKGLICVGASFSQCKDLIDPSLTETILQPALKTWPGPYTWLIPARRELSSLLTGGHSSLAIRISDHPIIQQLCLALESPLTSTSANLSNKPALLTYEEVCKVFSDKVDYLCEGKTSGLNKPSKILDLLSGREIRA